MEGKELFETLLQDVWVAPGKVQVENLERFTLCEYTEPTFPACAFGIGRVGRWRGRGKS